MTPLSVWDQLCCVCSPSPVPVNASRDQRAPLERTVSVPAGLIPSPRHFTPQLWASIQWTRTFSTQAQTLENSTGGGAFKSVKVISCQADSSCWEMSQTHCGGGTDPAFSFRSSAVVSGLYLLTCLSYPTKTWSAIAGHNDIVKYVV